MLIVTMENFAGRFCALHRIRTEGYARAMFWRCLHRWAVPVAPLILWMNRQYFAADYEFILGVGAITSRGALHAEIEDYETHPFNRGFFRRGLKLRVSVQRVTDAVASVMPRNGSVHGEGSAEPWAARRPEGGDAAKMPPV